MDEKVKYNFSQNKKRRKRFKLRPRFYVFLLFLIILGLAILIFNISRNEDSKLEEEVNLSSVSVSEVSKQEYSSNVETKNEINKQFDLNNSGSNDLEDVSSYSVDENSQEDSSSAVKNESKINKDFDFSSWNSSCDWNLIVVNGVNYIPTDYKINTVTYDGLEVDSRIYGPLDRMFNAARSEGLYLTLSSAYRDRELQEILFNREVKHYTNEGYSQSEARNLAKTAVAVPGTSEHQTGLAVDLNGVTDDFKYTDEYEWLCNNAYKYGFIERYTEEKRAITGIIPEPWHYRYVGVENAKKIVDSNYCLEEYIYSLVN